MEELRVELKDKKYPIYIGYDILKKFLKNYRDNYSFSFIITHSFLYDLYKEDLEISQEGIIYVPVGEKSKSFKEVIRISRELAQRGADRKSAIFAFGGGVIGDLTGFVASIYMRGIRYIQIPTTLLAQVDSSIGGKTGINIKEGKNLIGTFYHPDAVIIDIKTLNTLPEREYRSGIAEVIKYGMIMNQSLFNFLEKNTTSILNKDIDILSHIIRESLICKKYVVEKDEKESSLRMILNFGHTFGHAIEAKGGYKRFLHGEAVAIGMFLATYLAYKIGFCDYSVLKRLQDTLLSFGFDLNNPYRIEDLVGYIKRDKKAYGGKIRLILPKEIGKVEIVENLEEKDIIKALKAGDGYGK
ncbi:3-dehydroquinate synthase [Dictyoglomus thermophilum]|uniref:3-dehydroquinate synthase n=1 Tax=Dictyoglomus thermophilum (strain ATCC 35947 / DSM 3960 / H-6-12) TaxID=309799 RepID=AROB_DICT6|nr:3-dehydroquinate synthase [Dictyoglomus thermophilum]B5YE18.1 RecName: Full=3-dehydroquinate synthase; Short=DHQS [Dictyoglomus thermophilum H-6-12]ACI19103.1 3-dehydroquinate synthase [Dictyoglomus thermophilum H-6-12]